MSYEASTFGSAAPRRSGRRYEVYTGPSRDRSREYLHAVNDRSRSRHDYKIDRHEVYMETSRRENRLGDRRNSFSRRDLYTGGRENLIPEKRVIRSRPNVDTNRPCKVLGVFGLSTRTAERDLYNIFSEFGRVRDIKMVYDNLTGRSRGFAFVYFDTSEAARRAKSICDDGLEIDGRMTRVDFSVTQAPHPPTPGVYMGKFKRNSDFDFDARGGRRFPREYRGRDAPHPSRSAPLVSHRRFSGSPRIGRSSRVADVDSSHHRVHTLISSRSRSPTSPIYTKKLNSKLKATSSRRSISISLGSPQLNVAKKPRLLVETWSENASPSPV